MNKEIGNKVFQQVLDLWVMPEIKRRVDRGLIDDKYKVFKAQVLFSFDLKFPKVRLNEQVKGVGKAKLKKGTSKIKGEEIYLHEVEDIGEIKLTEDDPNSGHITMIMANDGMWRIFFDFRYNKGHANERLVAARDHLDTAHEAISNNRLRSFYEVCFAAVEAMTEAILITHANKNRYKDHDVRQSDLYEWAKLGNISMDYPITLKKLRQQLRPAARYFESTVHEKENASLHIKTLENMYDLAKQSIE